MTETNTEEIAWPQPGMTITRANDMVYTLGEMINQGAFGLVYEGIDLFGNAVALKVFKPANKPFEEIQKYWESETNLFQKLRHPNIVAIYDSFLCAKLFYIVLEKAHSNLEQFINLIGGKAEESYVKEIARQLLFGIHFIHREGVLQRDLTINNVLIFEGPQSKGPVFKISDFGISENFIQSWVPKVSFSKTIHPLYQPPELLNFGYTNEQSDLYHLGLVLLYCLTGSLPFDTNMEQEEINKQIIDGVPRQQAENIKTPMGEFVSILLRRTQNYRFKTALEAWHYLKQI